MKITKSLIEQMVKKELLREYDPGGKARKWYSPDEEEPTSVKANRPISITKHDLELQVPAWLARSLVDNRHTTYLGSHFKILGTLKKIGEGYHVIIEDDAGVQHKYLIKYGGTVKGYDAELGILGADIDTSKEGT